MKKPDSRADAREGLVLVLAEYNRYRISVLFVVLLLFAALIFIFINRYVTFGLLALALPFHFLYSRRIQKAYADSVNRINLSLTVMPRLGAEVIRKNSDGGLSRSVMQRAGMMPCDGDPLLLWGMEGDAGRFHVQLADASIPQKFVLKKGGKKRIHFNVGVWTHIVLPEDTGYRYCVIDETAVPTPIRMAYFEKSLVMFNAELGDPSLKGKAVLYRPMNEDDQRPAPAVLDALRDLISYTPGYTAMSVHGNEMDLFIRGRFLAGPVTVSKKPTEAALSFDPFPELDRILKIAERLSKAKRSLPNREEAGKIYGSTSN